MWPVQQYTKFALSLAYFPDSTCKTAARRLNRWIERDKELSTALVANGYAKNQRHFTASQTALIFEHLGEP